MSVKRSDLKFVAVDDWARFTFKDITTDKYYCTIDRLLDEGDTLNDVEDIRLTCDYLYIKTPSKDFEGEPSHPIKIED